MTSAAESNQPSPVASDPLRAEPTWTGGDTSGNSRLSNTTACLPIVYGSVAVYLGKKADEFSTHKWSLYLRGPNDEDLSFGIAKVIFQLHPSFAQPVRELVSPPFEVTERGWGEFEAQIRILWKDPDEKPTVLTHGIKLYPAGTTNMQPTKEPIVAESFDEVVFTDPKEFFYQQLIRISNAPKMQSTDPEVQACYKRYSDEDDFQKLLEAQNFLSKELAQVKERMKMVNEDLEQVDRALIEVQEAKKATATSSRASAPVKAKAGAATAAATAPTAKKAKVVPSLE